MAELVWSKAVPNGASIENLLQSGDQNRAAVVPGDRRASIFAGGGKVALVHSQQWAGRPAGGSDKRFYFWDTYSSMGFRTLDNGTILPYYCRRETKGSRKRQPWQACTAIQLWDTLAEDTVTGREFAFFVKAELGITELGDLYPAATLTHIYKYGAMPWTIRGHYRANTIDQFAERLFGKTRYSKPLASALETAQPLLVSLAHQMRGLAYQHQIVDFLSRDDHEEEDRYFNTVADLRIMWRQINPLSFQHLLGQPFTMQSLRELGSIGYLHNGLATGKIKIDPKPVVYRWSDLHKVIK